MMVLAFESDLASYFASKLGEGFGMSLPALLIPFLFRWSRSLSLASGVLAGIAAPVALIYSGQLTGALVDHAILLSIAAVFGAFFGLVANGTYRNREQADKPGRWRSSGKQ